MRKNFRPSAHFDPANDFDPREDTGAEVIDLATRRVMPTVTQRKPRSEGFGLAAGVAVVGLLGALTLWSMDAARHTPPPAKSTGQQVRFDLPPSVPAGAITVPGDAPLPAPGGAPATADAPSPAQTASVSDSNAMNAPTVVFDAGALPAPVEGGAATTAGATGSGNEAFADRLGVAGNGAAVASNSINPRTTVTQGTLIPAILETAIDTDVPGYVRAVVSSDVRSFDGTRVLVPRSSRLIGEYKSGLQAGQKRAYVIWTRLIRTDGVSVNIASPAVGFGGETGIAGKVNTHFFERFGSAMLLSVVGGLSSTMGGTSGVIIANSGQSAASTAVGQTGQIPPTVRVRQGEPIRVFTARDLDFSRVASE
jgi:type IV secretion system protein VirB10